MERAKPAEAKKVPSILARLFGVAAATAAASSGGMQVGALVGKMWYTPRLSQTERRKRERRTGRR